MTPVEMMARREALGLSRKALAEVLNIREENVNRWEFGKNHPRDWSWIDEALTALEDHQETLIEEMVTSATERHQGTGELVLMTFHSRRDYYRWLPEARQKEWAPGVQGIPVELHRSATARAAAQLRRQYAEPVQVHAAPDPVEED